MGHREKAEELKSVRICHADGNWSGWKLNTTTIPILRASNGWWFILGWRVRIASFSVRASSPRRLRMLLSVKLMG